MDIKEYWVKPSLLSNMSIKNSNIYASPKVLYNIEKVAIKDFTLMFQLAHKFKGTFSDFGMLFVASKAGELQNLAEQRNEAQMKDIIEFMDSQFKLAREEVMIEFERVFG